LITKIFVVLIFFFLPTSSFTKNTIKLNSIIEENNFEKHNLVKFSEELKIHCYQNLNRIIKHHSYPIFGTKGRWENICKKIKKIKKINFLFLKQNFDLKLLSNNPGLLTGYYEPEILVSKKRNKKFKIPILKYNNSYKNLSREIITKNFNEKDVLLWTDDKIDLFFLQIQGSGIGVLQNKKRIKISYAGNNNKAYTSIGKYLFKEKLMTREINLFTIKKFLRNNLELTNEILNQNERYIFFKLDETNITKNTKGALGRTLTPNLSIAIDNKYYPLGLPILIKKIKDNKNIFSISMDVGSAIKGKNRADLFSGRGVAGEKLAGDLKDEIFLYTLVPSEAND
jgi:membrane-bound lytic murein transglycosylase A